MKCMWGKWERGGEEAGEADLTWGGGASLPAGRVRPRGSNTMTRVKVFKCKHTSILVDRVCTRGDCGESWEDEADDGGGASSCGGLPPHGSSGLQAPRRSIQVPTNHHGIALCTILKKLTG